MAVEIDINKCSKNIKMNVYIKGTKKFQFKIFIGIQLIKLARYIMGFGGKIEKEVQYQMNMEEDNK